VAGNGPFATIARARDAVRALRKARKPDQAIQVVLRGGTYHLDTTLELGPEDSGAEKAPVIYAAAPGEKVILSGEDVLKAVTGARSTARRPGWWTSRRSRPGTWRFRQLFVNGERRPRTAPAETG
jgi:hypothetical protein